MVLAAILMVIRGVTWAWAGGSVPPRLSTGKILMNNLGKKVKEKEKKMENVKKKKKMRKNEKSKGKKY